MMVYNLTFAGDEDKNSPLTPQLWDFSGFSVCQKIMVYFYFFVSAKTFFISPRVRIRLLKSIFMTAPMSFRTSS